MGLRERVLELKKKKNALVLAHNYQVKEIQEIADFVGDSLELAKRASRVEQELIVFCGVDFMAEITKILNPEKKVLMPDLTAKCPMAAQLSVEILKEFQERFKGASTVLYVNTSTEAKALADSCCTSANAAKIVNAVDSSEVLFGPDKNLAYFVKNNSIKEVIPVPKEGFCPTHDAIDVYEVLEEKRKHPNALVIAHPECVPEVQRIADFVESTSGMVKRAREEKADEFIIATETGLIARLEREMKGKKFYPASPTAICPAMKKNTLEKVLHALEKGEFEVKIEKELMEKARKPIERMFELG